MCFYKYKDLLALALIILIVAPYTYVFVYASTYSVPIGPSNKSRVTIDFVVASFKANIISSIIGSKISSLHIATCIGNELIEGSIYITPRRYVKSFLPPLNRSIEIPIIGEDKVLENDTLIAIIPVPKNILESDSIGISSTRYASGIELIGSCGWGVQYAKKRLHNRVFVEIPIGSRVYIASINKVVNLKTPIRFYIYFDKEIGSHRTPIDISITKLAKSLELDKYSTLVKVVRIDHKKNFLLNEGLTKIIDTNVDTKVIQQSEPPVIDGGGEASGYWFALRLINTSIIDYVAKELYVGKYVYSSELRIRANSTSTTSNAVLEVKIKVIDVTTGDQVSSIVRSYTLGKDPVSITLYPDIPYSSTSRYKVSITFRHIDGAKPYIILATLAYKKVYPEQPIPQTSLHRQIISTGVSFPDEIGRASQYGNLYGLKMVPGEIDCITFDTQYINGMYYESIASGNISIDILFENRLDTSVEGYVYIYVNGIKVGEEYVGLSKHTDPGYSKKVSFTISLSHLISNNLWTSGSYITIEHTLNLSGIYVYYDVAIDALYAPEVWDPESKSWVEFMTPLAKVFANNYYGYVRIAGISLVMEPKATLRGNPAPIRTTLKASIDKGCYNCYIGSIKIRLYIPSELPLTLSAGCYKIENDYSSVIEEAIGLAATAHYLLATGLESLSLLGIVSIPSPVSVGIFVAGLFFTILQGVKSGGSTTWYSENGYTVIEYIYDPGWNTPKYGEYRLEATLGLVSQGGGYTLYFDAVICTSESVTYVFKTPATIYLQSLNDLPKESEDYTGFYSRSDIGYN